MNRPNAILSDLPYITLTNAARWYKGGEHE
jgi:hypothetical protein